MSAGASALSWLSPKGWAQHVRADGEDNWAVLVLFLLVAAALLVLARTLLDRRDLGLALFPARLGPASNDRLDSPLALAVGCTAAHSSAGWSGSSPSARSWGASRRAPVICWTATRSCTTRWPSSWARER